MLRLLPRTLRTHHATDSESQRRASARAAGGTGHFGLRCYPWPHPAGLPRTARRCARCVPAARARGVQHYRRPRKGGHLHRRPDRQRQHDGALVRPVPWQAVLRAHRQEDRRRVQGSLDRVPVGG
ncbi:hypothetical protein FDH70_gp38 [Pseudomonas phage PaMx25]|uniref:Uncharacterized protein n=1 Tax=Pseudomonas phage PaMx25 TaxID=1175654 RepID=A0A0S0N8D5_9CAUD|nr:hypothetical protein FDH70_gp38 [Pseudomonas phage PaMx25]ALH23792.1 hypothetical protein PaMx25_38 [Pseudomonas phage PaMx25]